MAKSEPDAPVTVDAHPTKRFFVEMLTRDIDLEDAVLDLLDNCIDGILRQTHPEDDEEAPYKKYWAKIHFSKQSFTITDNCGGIDRDTALKVAFRLGRPKEAPSDDLPTVGFYGIGMKRAIFKFGREATVTSKTSDDTFQILIKPSWLTNDTEWNLPLEEVSRIGPTGTTIEVTRLHPVIGNQFANEQFIENFRERVATHYGLIISKGFKVHVNETPVVPTPLKFLFSLEAVKAGVAPFLYEATYDHVNIWMAVGFYKPIPTPEELEEGLTIKHTRENAGWTVVCNDRVVVYCDKTMLTGWGETGIPGFHAQFNAIAGIVKFNTHDPKRLPVTTTKRGIDAGSTVYLFAKNSMREGMKYFTNYTNKWKERTTEERERTKTIPASPFAEVQKLLPKSAWSKITKNDLEKERKFVPKLPLPQSNSNEQNIRFTRSTSQVRKVSDFLFDGDKGQKPSDVGAAAFDWVYEKTKS